MLNDIPIIQKIYDFYRDFYRTLPIMPKQDRHTLGERIQNICLDIYENLISTSHSDKQIKSKYLAAAASKLDLLKNLIRLSEDIKAIPTKRYLAFSEKLQEIGKMLGGWIRSLN